MRGRGESHTCRVLLEMKETFELWDLDTTAQPYRTHTHKHMCKDMRAHTHTHACLWYCSSLMTSMSLTRQIYVGVIKKRTVSHLCAHTQNALGYRRQRWWQKNIKRRINKLIYSCTGTVKLVFRFTSVIKHCFSPSQHAAGSEEYSVRVRCGSLCFPQSMRSV